MEPVVEQDQKKGKGSADEDACRERVKEDVVITVIELRVEKDPDTIEVWKDAEHTYQATVSNVLRDEGCRDVRKEEVCDRPHLRDKG